VPTDFATPVDLTEVTCPDDIRELLVPDPQTPEYNRVLAKRRKRSTQAWKAMTAVTPEPVDIPPPHPGVEPEPKPDEAPADAPAPAETPVEE
jgi:hypothetical protein